MVVKECVLHVECLKETSIEVKYYWWFSVGGERGRHSDVNGKKAIILIIKWAILNLTLRSFLCPYWIMMPFILIFNVKKDILVYLHGFNIGISSRNPFWISNYIVFFVKS